MYVDERMLKVLKQCQLQTYHVADRVLSLSGDIEKNPGPSHQCSVNTNSSVTSSAVSLLESWLSSLNRTALDVGGGGDCFSRAVSHQLFGNPNNQFHVRTLGVQYLEQCPEQFSVHHVTFLRHLFSWARVQPIGSPSSTGHVAL